MFGLKSRVKYWICDKCRENYLLEIQFCNVLVLSWDMMLKFLLRSFGFELPPSDLFLILFVFDFLLEDKSDELILLVFIFPYNFFFCFHLIQVHLVIFCCIPVPVGVFRIVLESQESPLHICVLGVYLRSFWSLKCT